MKVQVSCFSKGTAEEPAWSHSPGQERSKEGFMRPPAPCEEPAKATRSPKAKQSPRNYWKLCQRRKERKLLGQDADWKVFWNCKQINWVLLLDSPVVQGNRTLIFYFFFSQPHFVNKLGYIKDTATSITSFYSWAKPTWSNSVTLLFMRFFSLYLNLLLGSPLNLAMPL